MSSDLEGATETGYRGAFPSTPGEFAARWNAHTEEQRAEFLIRINEAHEEAIRRITSLTLQ